MGLKDQIDADIKAAMLAREKDKLNALRAIKSAILLELTREGGQGSLDETAGMKILQKLHKQRQESAAIYRQQGREDLAAEEDVQARVIEDYLPQRMSGSEVQAIVKEVIASTGASSMADMGRVMGEANKQLAGRADGALIATIVKNELSTS